MANIKIIFNPASWGNFIPVVMATFRRFPLSVIAVLATFVFGLQLIHEVELASDEIIGKLMVVSLFSSVALTSMKLFGESEDWSTFKQAGGAIVVILIIVGFVWEIVGLTSEETYAFFSLAIGLSLLFAPYSRRNSDASSVWYFNYQTGVAVFFGGIAALILGAGISLSLLSIGYLFEMDIPSEAYGDVWLLSGSILFPIYVLSNISEQFDFEEEGCEFPWGVRFITNYLLTPMMITYMVILYAYFFKIVAQWELPRGNLGWMICTFGSIGIATKLLAYPIRNTGTQLLQLFDRYYYHALIVPIFLLAIAIGVRINQYGVTEARYAVAMLGVWFVLAIVLVIIKKDRFHIKFLPIMLALLALLGSIGPWSAIEVSTSSQASRFIDLLEKHSLVENGEAVKSTKPISFSDRKILSGVADYLASEDHRFERIKPLFNTLLEQSGEEPTFFDDYSDGAAVLELMGLKHVGRWQEVDDGSSFSYNGHLTLDGNMADVSGFDFIGSGTMYLYDNESTENIMSFYWEGVPEEIMLTFDGSLISVKKDDGTRVQFDIGQVVSDLQNQNTDEESPVDLDKMTLTRSSENGTFKVRLLLQNVYGNVSVDKQIHIQNLDYTLMLKLDE